jgi:hypothetical protein
MTRQRSFAVDNHLYFSFFFSPFQTLDQQAPQLVRQSPIEPLPEDPYSSCSQVLTESFLVRFPEQVSTITGSWQIVLRPVLYNLASLPMPQGLLPTNIPFSLSFHEARTADFSPRSGTFPNEAWLNSKLFPNPTGSIALVEIVEIHSQS